MFEEFDRQSQEQSDDPLEQMLNFLELFETYISNSDDPAPGCMYAVYTYESRQFDPDVLDFVSDTLRKWTAIYVRKFQAVMDVYAPALDVTPRQLAEMIYRLSRVDWYCSVLTEIRAQPGGNLSSSETTSFFFSTTQK